VGFNIKKSQRAKLVEEMKSQSLELMEQLKTQSIELLKHLKGLKLELISDKNWLITSQYHHFGSFSCFTYRNSQSLEELKTGSHKLVKWSKCGGLELLEYLTRFKLELISDNHWLITFQDHHFGIFS
jgi:hypothetical protein